jgi:hypothetical protein
LRIKSAICSTCCGAGVGVVGSDNGGRLTPGNSGPPEGCTGSCSRSSAFSGFELRNVIAFARSAARSGGSVKAILAS